jgi:CBS domain-containing protein
VENVRAERRIDARAGRRFYEIDQEAYSQLQVSVTDVMERDVTTVPEDTSVESVTWALLARGVSGAPVVDLDGRLAGFVSMTDIVREQFEQGETVEALSPREARAGGRAEETGAGFFPTRIARATAREVMSEDVVAVSAGATLHRTVLLMAAHGVERVTVVGEDRRVVGVVSTMGILRWLARQAGHAAS